MSEATELALLRENAVDILTGENSGDDTDEDFRAVVTTDSHRRSIHEKVKEASQEKLKELVLG